MPLRSTSLYPLVGVAALCLVACAPRDRPTDAAASPGSVVAQVATITPATAAAPPVASVDASPDADLARALRTSDPGLAAWMDQAADLRLQVLVTEVRPSDEAWVTYAFRADAEYFYPASAIKPFLAIAALRFASAKAKKPIEPGSRIIRCAHDRPRCEPPPADEDKDAEKEAATSRVAESSDDGSGEPKKLRKKLTLGEEIQKLLSYSDNDSYDRLYDLVGHRELNETMRAIGFADVRFQHPTEGPPELRKTTLATRLVRPSGQAIAMKERTSDFTFPALELGGLGIGAKHQGEHGLVDGPMDFSIKNRASLHDLQRVLMSLVRPEHAGVTDLGLTEAQRSMLVSAMTRSPQPGAKVADHSPMAPGVLDSVPPKSLRYIGKAGKAYGFLLESAYIENKDTHRAVFVAATVLANPDGVMNDDVYGYEEIARPALRAIGAAVANRFLIDRPAP